MIGYLKGIVVSKNPETGQCVLLCHRTGYEVTVNGTLLDRVTMGQRIALWIHTHVREDVFSLYGFATEEEKLFFRLLLSVSGLGPKSSLALLAEHGASNLVHYIRHQDAVSLSKAPGIGKKLAQKIILELHSKIDRVGTAFFTPAAPTATPTTLTPSHLRDDVLSALVNLGFAPNQAKPALERVFDAEGAEKEGFESCLKKALKQLNTRPIAAEEMSHGG